MHVASAVHPAACRCFGPHALRVTNKTCLSIPVLRAALDRALQEVTRRYGDSVELGADYYYYVLPVERAYDFGTTPDGAACTVASLSDDIEEAARLAGLAGERPEPRTLTSSSGTTWSVLRACYSGWRPSTSLEWHPHMPLVAGYYRNVRALAIRDSAISIRTLAAPARRHAEGAHQP